MTDRLVVLDGEGRLGEEVGSFLKEEGGGTHLEGWLRTSCRASAHLPGNHKGGVYPDPRLESRSLTALGWFNGNSGRKGFDDRARTGFAETGKDTERGRSVSALAGRAEMAGNHSSPFTPRDGGGRGAEAALHPEPRLHASSCGVSSDTKLAARNSTIQDPRIRMALCSLRFSEEVWRGDHPWGDRGFYAISGRKARTF